MMCQFHGKIFIVKPLVRDGYRPLKLSLTEDGLTAETDETI